MKNSILDGNPKFGTILLTDLIDFRSNVLESKEMWLVVFVDPSGKSIKPEWDKGGFQLEFVSMYKPAYKSHDLF